MFDYQTRQKLLAAQLEEHSIDAIFVAPGSDLEYLCGIERDVPTFGATSYTHGWATGGLFRPDGEPVFVVPRLFELMHIKREVAGELIVLGETDDGRARFADALRGLGGLKRIALSGTTSARTLMEILDVVPDVVPQDGYGIVNRLRRIKSDEELVTMTAACRIAEEALDAVRPSVRPGVSMRELCDAVDQEMIRLGATVPSFTTHIHTLGLADKRDSADPATATLPLRVGESVKFDFGAAFHGYCSDFGRTYFCGEPSSELLATYEVLLAAQNAAIEAARPGATAGSVDVACRAVIEEAGLGTFFVHRTGHCIGLDVHELPFISEEDETPLEPGMTYTIEPSINVPQRVGMRIEDVVVTEAAGARTLTDYPSELIVVP